jgi:hypothetical protein
MYKKLKAAGVGVEQRKDYHGAAQRQVDADAEQRG